MFIKIGQPAINRILRFGVNFAATKLMNPDALKSAMDRQFRIYQTMARFSPLSLALQMVQGLLPTDRPRSQP